MNYYSIKFPYHITLIVESDLGELDVLYELQAAVGLRTPSGTTYNPTTYISMEKIDSPDKIQLQVALSLDEALMQ